jgi:hypothetical protein
MNCKVRKNVAPGYIVFVCGFEKLLRRTVYPQLKLPDDFEPFL